MNITSIKIQLSISECLIGVFYQFHNKLEASVISANIICLSKAKIEIDLDTNWILSLTKIDSRNVVLHVQISWFILYIQSIIPVCRIMPSFGDYFNQHFTTCRWTNTVLVITSINILQFAIELQN